MDLSIELRGALTEKAAPVGTQHKWRSGIFVKTAHGWRPKSLHHIGRRLKAKGKLTARRVGAKTKAAGVGLAHAIKSLPHAAKRLVTDSAYRSEVGKKAGQAVKRKGKAFIKYLGDEVHEFGHAGKALKKIALGQKLDHHEKQALKSVAKTLASAIAGTIALEHGFEEVTALAVAHHMVLEAFTKHSIRAALRANLAMAGANLNEDSAVEDILERIINDVGTRLESLGDMSDEEVHAMLKKHMPKK